MNTIKMFYEEGRYTCEVPCDYTSRNGNTIYFTLEVRARTASALRRALQSEEELQRLLNRTLTGLTFPGLPYNLILGTKTDEPV